MFAEERRKVLDKGVIFARVMLARVSWVNTRSYVEGTPIFAWVSSTGKQDFEHAWACTQANVKQWCLWLHAEGISEITAFIEQPSECTTSPTQAPGLTHLLSSATTSSEPNIAPGSTGALCASCKLLGKMTA